MGRVKDIKRRQCSNQQGVGHETRFSKDNWESMYFKIFWKSWNWPSYSRECLLYRLRWHLVVEMTIFTVKKPKSASRYNLLWMWRHLGTRLWSCLSEPTEYQHSATSGTKTQHTVITSHCSQYRVNGPLRSPSWKFWGYSDIGPCVVLATVLDRHFGSGSRSDPNRCQTDRAGCQYTWTINLGPVRCKSHNPSELGR